MKNSTKSAEAISIDARDERSVLFEPLSEDRFVLSCGDTIRCTQIGMGFDALGDEIRTAIGVAKKWVESRASQVKACFATLSDGQVLFIVVPQSDAFNFELAKELTDLDIEIAEETLCPCEVIQVPARSSTDLSGFANLRYATTVYGNLPGT